MEPTLNVVITGASAGLGRAMAREFGKANARVGLISRDLPALEATAAEVESLGGTAATYAADVSDDQAVEAAAASFEERLGPIDVWINNAMVSVFSPIKEMEAAEFRRVTEVNYLGYVHGTLAALRRMLPRNHGRIIQVGSALAVRSIPLQAAYCATKHAIVGFTDSLRCELYHDKSKVKAIVVHMPAMNTPQFTWVKSRLPSMPQPVPPIYEPEVGARVVLHAALDIIAAAGVLGGRVDSQSHRRTEIRSGPAGSLSWKDRATKRSNAKSLTLLTGQIMSGILSQLRSARMGHLIRGRGRSAWKHKYRNIVAGSYLGAVLSGRRLARKLLAR